MGKVIGIAAQEKENLPVTVYASAKVSFKNGIADDYRGALQNEHQITVIALESWEEVCSELNTKLHWTSSNAHLLIEGVDLVDSVGDILRIGNFYLEITAKNTPGDSFDDVFIGLKEALTPNWRAGVIAKVYSEGVVNEKDEVTLMTKD
jgi:MOSC domain-containing protein YiiM